MRFDPSVAIAVTHTQRAPTHPRARARTLTQTHTHTRFFSLYLSKRLSLFLLAHHINKSWWLPDNYPDRIVTSSQLLHREIWFSFIFATFLEDPAYNNMMVVPRPDNTNFINVTLKLIKFEFFSSLFIEYLLRKRIFLLSRALNNYFYNNTFSIFIVMHLHINFCMYHSNNKSCQFESSLFIF